MLERVERIREAIRKRDTTSHHTATPQCSKCGDRGWVQREDEVYVRCDCFELNYIKRLWEIYGVRPEEIRPLRDYNTYNKICTAAKIKAVNYVNTFKEIKNLENNWFGLFGQAGSGKTYIATAIGAALLNMKDKAVKAVYMPYLEVMRELKANAREEDYYNKLLTRYQRSEVLIIDDLFKDKINKGKLTYPLTEVDIKHIYPIINYRYFNKLPTIISSECTPSMLVDLDEGLGGRIMQRCDENIIIFKGAECNYRLKKFERRDENQGKSC